MPLPSRRSRRVFSTGTVCIGGLVASWRSSSALNARVSARTSSAIVVTIHASLLGDADQVQVDPATWRVDRPHGNRHRVAEADGAAGARADEHGALLVELPPVAAQAADRQQALVAVGAEGDEGARADQAGDL